MTATANPSGLLTTAERLLTSPPTEPAVTWRRGAAFALRAALEAVVSGYLLSRRPQVRAGSMRAKLLCLRTCCDTETARRAQTTWNLLCTACHYRPYDPGPTQDQLHMLQRQVSELVQQLSR